jgi:O-acetyl-ADP-ribose deacetylase (regulator of RNase III)
MALAMIRRFDIRQRSIEIRTTRLQQVPADALLLPWIAQADRDTQERRLERLGLDAASLLDEIAEYKGEREVMLTSPGGLPVRFLFHLTLPEKGAVDLALVEERFRDCLFQAGVLGLRSLAIPVLEFAAYSERFSELISTIWKACNEYLARDKGPRRILFIVEDRDLRGQYLRHFLRRKEAEEQGWAKVAGEPSSAEAMSSVIAAESPSPFLSLREEMPEELILSPAPTDPGTAAAGLAALLAAYAAGKDLGPSLSRMAGPLADAFLTSIPLGLPLAELPPQIRLLGAPEILRLPWELIGDAGGTYLGETHLLVRGTNFLHFAARRGPRPAHSPAMDLRVLGPDRQARRVAEELETFMPPGRAAGATPGREPSRLRHCLEESGAHALLAGEHLPCELAVLEWSAPHRAGEAGPEEWAAKLLAKGCRRVLAPLAPFRDERERSAYMGALYSRLFAGAALGEALHYGQRAVMEGFGTQSGWFLLRIYGHAQGALFPTQRSPALSELGGSLR